MRTLCLLVPVALAFLAGCEPDPGAGKTRIRYMAWGNPEALDLEQRLCDEFNARNPDIHVSFLKVPQSAYLNKAIVMFASRTAPDVVRIDHFNFPSLVRKDYFLNLSPLIARDPEFKSTDYFPATLDEGRYKGDIFGMNVLFGAILIYYNKTMFQKAGLEDPYELYRKGEWTYERMRQSAIRLSKTDQNGRPTQFGLILPPWPLTVPIVWAFGGEVLSPDMTQSRLDSPGTAKAFQFLTDLRWKDKASPTPSQAANSAFPFESGKVGMEFNWMGQSVRYRKVATSFEWDVVPVPRGPAGNPTILKGNQLVIYRETRQPEAAWRFVKFITGDYVERLLYVQRRRSFPTRKAIAGSKEFLETKERPFNTKAFVDSIANGRPLPINHRWGEWTNASNAEIDALFSGRSRNAKAVMAEAHRKAAKVLADEEGF